jgi:hypothetical protein
MSDTKFTPGPWKWHDDRSPDSIEGEFRRLDGPNSEDVIRVEDMYPGYAECGEDLRACVERPNQFLIAAAPDLYAALDALIAYTPMKGDAAALLRYGKAQNALKKARGES